MTYFPRLSPAPKGRPLGAALILTLMFGAVAAVLPTPETWARPLLVYNASASVPLGYYRIIYDRPLHRGDLVLIHTPDGVRQLAATRGYLPATVPMIKRISGTEGDRVCAIGARVLINDQFVATRLLSDHLGRPMPWWTGCQTLKKRDLFLLNPLVPLSFDGRYFGVIQDRLVIGKARPL